MPWQEVSMMDQRREFVRLAMQEGANRRELCRRFGIHPETGYKWLGRWRSRSGARGSFAASAREPLRAVRAIEERVMAVREAQPAWGARKIADGLARKGRQRSGPCRRSMRSSRRHGRILAPAGGLRPPSASRSLSRICCGRWISRAGSGLPTAPLPPADHPRRPFALRAVSGACGNEQGGRCRPTQRFRRYGLPDAFFVDNGKPVGKFVAAQPGPVYRVAAELGIAAASRP